MALLPGLFYPLINGRRYDWSTIEAKIAGSLLGLGLKEIDYAPKLEPGEVRGAGASVIGRTRGLASYKASMTLLKEEFNLFIGSLGPGYGEEPWDLSVSYADDLGPLTATDTLIGCRIVEPSQSQSQTSEGLVVKVELSVMRILLNGLPITLK